jgi:hypothetical protein
MAAMPAPKLPLTEALELLRSLGRASVTLHSSAATANLVGPLEFVEKGGELHLKVGCACSVVLVRERLRQAVFGEKDFGSGPEAHVQVFDGNYDKIVAFRFPEGVKAVRELAARLDGNDFEIAAPHA